MNTKTRSTLYYIGGVTLWVLGLSTLMGAGYFLGYTYAYNNIPSVLDNYKYVVYDSPYDEVNPNDIIVTEPRGRMRFIIFYYLEVPLAFIGVALTGIGRKIFSKHEKEGKLW